MQAEHTARVCVVGVGSPFGDDQLGWFVVERLEQIAPSLADYVQCSAPSRELLPILRDREHVIIVDALHSEALSIGTCREWQGVDAICQLPNHLSSHGFDVANTVQLAKQLGWQPRYLRFYGIDIDINTCQPTALHAPLSPPVAQAMELLIEALHTDLQAIDMNQIQASQENSAHA
ncbi:hydrogenase maturation protease [Beggiatoa alba B18LD]|uniref:Hydrogenase maturation protease n=1 Tax=Beggiatoa alba B18LD TaxID=395493 RepID=I3CK79_9GAMM|nr:hydrogenase maturation protease [Beggiatoa alba]EIJ44022.1 hydrogenase maturation protease [Beggiatoa alba B18LD]